MVSVSLPDIDIDVSDRITALYDHVYVPASLYHSGDLKRHPTGVYYQNVPKDPISGGASFPTGKGEDDIAGSLGYYKIDILSNHAYDLVESPEHLDELLEKPVDWSLFLDKKIVEQLHQLGNQFEIVDAYEPKSIDDLACIIAVIRPAKRHLLGQPYEVLRKEVWKKETDGYSFKKSHAYAYALSIIAQLQSIVST
jgi:hypothetical protein